MSGKKHKKKQFKQMGDDLDLVPLIDVVFLILLFFILCGRLTLDQRTEQITVPPTKTAVKLKEMNEWERVIVNVFGSTKSGSPPRNTISMPPMQPWVTSGIDDYTGYQKLRDALNKVHDKAVKYDDPKGSGMRLPKVIVEIRADADTEYRVVQEIQQVLSDTIDPFNNMLPRQGVDPKSLKCFVNVDFTTRLPGDAP
jgi:biopolymer transport protein ExbD